MCDHMTGVGQSCQSSHKSTRVRAHALLITNFLVSARWPAEEKASVSARRATFPSMVSARPARQATFVDNIDCVLIMLPTLPFKDRVYREG